MCDQRWFFLLSLIRHPDIRGHEAPHQCWFSNVCRLLTRLQRRADSKPTKRKILMPCCQDRSVSFTPQLLFWHGWAVKRPPPHPLPNARPGLILLGPGWNNSKRERWMEFRALSVQRKNSSPHKNVQPWQHWASEGLCPQRLVQQYGRRKGGRVVDVEQGGERRGCRRGSGCLLLVLMQKALTLLCWQTNNVKRRYGSFVSFFLPGPGLVAKKREP